MYLSFPLLKKLTDAGDPLAKKVFKDEILLRLSSNYPNVMLFLLEGGYLKYFTIEELKSVKDIINESKIQHIIDLFNKQYGSFFKINPQLAELCLKIKEGYTLNKRKESYFLEFSSVKIIIMTKDFKKEFSNWFNNTKKVLLHESLIDGECITFDKETFFNYEYIQDILKYIENPEIYYKEEWPLIFMTPKFTGAVAPRLSPFPAPKEQWDKYTSKFIPYMEYMKLWKQYTKKELFDIIKLKEIQPRIKITARKGDLLCYYLKKCKEELK